MTLMPWYEVAALQIIVIAAVIAMITLARRATTRATERLESGLCDKCGSQLMPDRVVGAYADWCPYCREWK